MQKNIVLSLQVYSEQGLGVSGENSAIAIPIILQRTSVWMLKLVCTFPLQHFSFDKSMFSVKISLLKNSQSVPVGMCLQLEWVSHIHFPLAHIAVIQTDTMIGWVFGRLVLAQWQRDASVIFCSSSPHGGPVQVTSSLRIAATLWMQMTVGRTWKKKVFCFRILFDWRHWAMVTSWLTQCK